MNCDIDRETLICSRCGHKAFAANVRRNCRNGLGDRVAAGLSAIGITKERAQTIAAAAGVSDCGCAGRQAALNEFGYALGIGTPPPPPTGPNP